MGLGSRVEDLGFRGLGVLWALHFQACGREVLESLKNMHEPMKLCVPLAATTGA